jgi:anaerobic ribonucleoside-triphosphate reductase activating protein
MDVHSCRPPNARAHKGQVSWYNDPPLETMRVAQLVEHTETEGPGRRFAVWLQGCPLRCPGCCNPEMLPLEGGEERSPSALARELAAAHARHALEGLTLAGGEPFAQAAEAAALALAARGMGLGVMTFSGWTLSELEARRDPGSAALLRASDLLVDGRYRRELPEPRRRWIGSANQALCFLSDRYRPDDPRFFAPNSVELRLAGGALVVNGWPGALELSR